jgi:hypothetical protein
MQRVNARQFGAMAARKCIKMIISLQEVFICVEIHEVGIARTQPLELQGYATMHVAGSEKKESGWYQDISLERLWKHKHFSIITVQSTGKYMIFKSPRLSQCLAWEVGSPASYFRNSVFEYWSAVNLSEVIRLPCYGKKGTWRARQKILVGSECKWETLRPNVRTMWWPKNRKGNTVAYVWGKQWRKKCCVTEQQSIKQISKETTI